MRNRRQVERALLKIEKELLDLKHEADRIFEESYRQNQSQQPFPFMNVGLIECANTLVQEAHRQLSELP